MKSRKLKAKKRAKQVDSPVLTSLIINKTYSEIRWGKLFAQSEDLLSELAEEALKEHRAGKTKSLSLDEL